VKWAQWDKTQSRELLVCSYVCALHCAQLLHTILHGTDLIVFPLTLQTITTSPMMSIWGKRREQPIKRQNWLLWQRPLGAGYRPYLHSVGPPEQQRTGRWMDKGGKKREGVSQPHVWQGDLDDPHLIHLSTQPKRFSIGSAIFAGLTSVTDRKTDRQTDKQTNRPHYLVSNNRPHLHM